MHVWMADAAEAVRMPVVSDDFVAFWITNNVRIRSGGGFEFPSIGGGRLKREFVSNAETQVVMPIYGSQPRHPANRRKHDPSARRIHTSAFNDDGLCRDT